MMEIIIFARPNFHMGLGFTHSGESANRDGLGMRQ